MARLIHADEIRQRLPEFRRICTLRSDSDLQRLLDVLAKGEDPIIAAAVEEVEGKAIGWAACERFCTLRGREWILLNVFVHRDYRRKGHATNIVNEVLRGVAEKAPGVRPWVEPEPEAFWRQFEGVQAVPWYVDEDPIAVL